MKRIHLTALITTALLSTSLQPTDWLEDVVASASVETPSASPLPPVSMPPPALDMPLLEVALEDSHELESFEEETVIGDAMSDQEIIDVLYARLSNRHTALSERERRRVAVTILEEARSHDLEPELVIAVIEVESAGYPLAVSHVGARGLMQLMPATGKEVARKRGIPWRGNDTLFDPIVNVKLGTYYLRELANKYGNVTVALAAYNWGPGAIDRRIERGKTVPVLYIEQVMAAYDRGTTRIASNAL